MKKIFICWKKNCTRSHNQAVHFGAKEIYISFFGNKPSVPLILLRYIVSFFYTFIVLFKEKPDIIFTLNQPPFLISVVYAYSWLFNCNYILDSHSAAFNDPKWAWARPLYRFIAKRAFLNINTNREHKQIVESWGGKSEVMSDIPIDHPRDYPRQEVEEKSIAVVASFMFDEPIAEIWQAANRVNDVHFYVTGNPDKLDQSLRATTPANIHLTGYLSTEDYMGLLQSAKAVMVLTKRDHTMQMGAYEALSLEQPIITSDWQVLRDSFGDSAVYVKNDPDSIAHGVNTMIQGHSKYKDAAIPQRRRRREYYEEVKQKILHQFEPKAVKTPVHSQPPIQKS